MKLSILDCVWFGFDTNFIVRFEFGLNNNLKYLDQRLNFELNSSIMYDIYTDMLFFPNRDVSKEILK